MQRRDFLRTSCTATLAALGAGATAYGQEDLTRRPGESSAAFSARKARARAMAAARRHAAGGQPDFLELRRYEIETEAQKAGMDAFLKEAAIPALNRLRIDPVGVFYPEEGLSPVYVLLRHKSFMSFVTLVQQLGEDEEFMQKGADFLNAPAENPAYKRMTSSLMVAFEGMPHLETPIKTPGRVLQLRTYESPSVITGQKKIEMFNTGEIEIFRKTGLNPVFFGESLTGEKLPNLTYMLVFNDQEERKANWKQFVSSPEWKALSSIPDYADKKILCGITNLFLKPAEYSQI